MTIFTGTVAFVLIWWTALFCVLPIGTRPDTDAAETPGGWRGAPVQARVGIKLLATTVLSVAIWLVIWLLIESEWLSFRTGLFAAPGN